MREKRAHEKSNHPSYRIVRYILHSFIPRCSSFLEISFPTAIHTKTVKKVPIRTPANRRVRPCDTGSDDGSQILTQLVPSDWREPETATAREARDAYFVQKHGQNVGNQSSRLVLGCSLRLKRSGDWMMDIYWRDDFSCVVPGTQTCNLVAASSDVTGLGWHYSS